jgi:hypothetical protein
MRNALVQMRFNLHLPEKVVKRILEAADVDPDDGNPRSFGNALDAIEEAVKDDPMGYIEYADEPDVEADA